MTTSTGIAHHVRCPVGRWLTLPCVVRDERPACTCPTLADGLAADRRRASPTFEEWLAGADLTGRPVDLVLVDDPFAEHLRPLPCTVAPVFPEEHQ